MATRTRFNSTTTKKDMLLEECKTMKPDLLFKVIPTVPALPLSRSLRIELDLVHQLALLAHQCGAV
eukprot:7839677-Prorocentrum_lima.AAC.1